MCVCVQISMSQVERKLIYPAEALNTDVVSVWATWCTINDAVLQLIICHCPGDPAEKLTAILHQNYMGKKKKIVENIVEPKAYFFNKIDENKNTE